MNEEFDRQPSAEEPMQNTAEPSGVQTTPVNGAQQENGAQPNVGYPYSNTAQYTQNTQQPSYANSFYHSGPMGQNGANPNYVYYGAPQPQKEKKKINPNGSKHQKKGLAVFLAVVAVCLVGAVVAAAMAFSKDGDTPKKIDAENAPSATIQETPTASSTGTNGELTAKGVYEKVKESSVGILVYSSSAYSNTALAGEGSGVIIGEDPTGTYTYIVTCAHVINDGGTVKVQLFDETQYDATIVGYDTRTDIGVLRIRATGLTAAELGDSDSLSVGETVYAIGNPGGVAFAGSFTNGMISAISRPVNSEIGYEMLCIQHTAAINPGNSGGALVNAYGQIVGINSSKIASTSYEGMGFAVPSTTVKEVFDEIVKNGYVSNRAKLGIQYFPASSNQMYSMIVGANHLPSGTVVIQSINSDSALVNTDVQSGDMITKANGKELESTNVLADLIEDSSVGDEITLTICRVDTKNNYSISEFEVTVQLVEDKGSASESTTQNSYYNPFGAYGYGN
ncbi:MAG: trypsin-like peptidase domain-containing protein [Candidatus Fimenecus sp.]